MGVQLRALQAGSHPAVPSERNEMSALTSQISVFCQDNFFFS